MTTAVLYAMIALASFGVYETSDDGQINQECYSNNCVAPESTGVTTSANQEKAVLDFIKG